MCCYTIWVVGLRYKILLTQEVGNYDDHFGKGLIKEYCIVFSGMNIVYLGVRQVH